MEYQKKSVAVEGFGRNRLYGGMLESADRRVSKTIVRNNVWAQIPLPLPQNINERRTYASTQYW